MIKFIHFPCWEVCFSNFTITSIRKSTPVMTVIISPSHPKRSDIVHFGTRFKSSWTGQLHWCSLRVRGYSQKTSSLDSINRDSGIEINFLKCGCLWSDNTTAYWYQYRWLREVCSSINAKNALDQNPPTISEVCDTPFTTNHVNANSSFQ